MGRIVLPLLLCTALAATGCTIVGGVIGSGIPQYEHADWRRSDVELGTRIRVRARSIGADTADVAAIEGRYGGIRDGLLSVTDDSGREHEIPASDILDVQTRQGTEWKKGLLIGAVADAVLVVTAVAIANGADVSIVTTH